MLTPRASERRVVVTGLGVATPIGIGIDAFWEALMANRCGIDRISAFDPSGFTSQIAGEIPSYKIADFIPKSYRKSIKVMSEDIKVAVVCAYHAVRHAGLDTKCLIERGEDTGDRNVDCTRLGASIGAGLVCADLTELAQAMSSAVADGAFCLHRWGSEGMGNLTPLWLLKFLPNMLACHVTIVHDAQATSNTITCGEASSHLAVGEAFRIIARGDADVCLCGGAESKLNPMALARAHLIGRLCVSCNDSPKQACRPFGLDRDGTVAAAGGGLVVLEALEHAKTRNATIYAEIAGFGASSNTHHWAEPDPTGQDLMRALNGALDDAQTEARRIDLIGTFGPGTVEHDAAEMKAWDAVIGDRLSDVPAIATKGAVGVNGAGAGAIDLAAMICAVAQQTVPPSLNTGNLDPTCKLRFVQQKPASADIRQAIGLGYALTGSQSGALVIRRFEE